MKHIILSILLCVGLTQCKEKSVTCVISTDLGSITIELYPERAPITVANFLTYVDSGRYKESTFFRACTEENEAERSVKIQVIQGGDMPADQELEPIVIETTQASGLLHLNGTVSMARSDPNSATCSFFICIGDQPSLDYGGARNPDGFGFAAFGQVIDGMEVVNLIQQVKEVDQYFVEPVRIVDIKRIN